MAESSNVSMSAILLKHIGSRAQAITSFDCPSLEIYFFLLVFTSTRSIQSHNDPLKQCHYVELRRIKSTTVDAVTAAAHRDQKCFDHDVHGKHKRRDSRGSGVCWRVCYTSFLFVYKKAWLIFLLFSFFIRQTANNDEQQQPGGRRGSLWSRFRKSKRECLEHVLWCIVSYSAFYDFVYCRKLVSASNDESIVDRKLGGERVSRLTKCLPRV